MKGSASTSWCWVVGWCEFPEQGGHVAFSPRLRWSCGGQYRWELSEAPQIQVAFGFFFKLIIGQCSTFRKCLLLPNALWPPHSVPGPWSRKPWYPCCQICPLHWIYYKISTEETLKVRRDRFWRILKEALGKYYKRLIFLTEANEMWETHLLIYLLMSLHQIFDNLPSFTLLPCLKITPFIFPSKLLTECYREPVWR